MPIRPIKSIGKRVPGGLPALVERLRQEDPERVERLERELKEGLTRIRENERAAWRKVHGTDMGPY